MGFGVEDVLELVLLELTLLELALFVLDGEGGGESADVAVFWAENS